ncbi:hypothetical protein glysoja_000418 [Glycine soja]|nr:hypothetical protein glysoja_000418 [Glycine soja]
MMEARNFANNPRPVHHRIPNFVGASVAAEKIYWDKLSPEKLGQIRILREFKKRIEQETGQKLPTGPSEKLPPIAQRSRRG